METNISADVLSRTKSITSRRLDDTKRALDGAVGDHSRALRQNACDHRNLAVKQNSNAYIEINCELCGLVFK